MPALLINRNDPAQVAKLKELSDKIAAGKVGDLGQEITLAQVLCIDTPIPVEIAGKQLRVKPVTVGQYIRLKPVLEKHERESGNRDQPRSSDEAGVSESPDQFIMSLRHLCEVLSVLVSTPTDQVSPESIQEAMPLCNFASIQRIVEDAINPTPAQPVR